MSKIFPAGAKVRCLDIQRTDKEKGFAIYPGQVYKVVGECGCKSGCDCIELELNGDGEPCTVYDKKFFELA